MYKKQIKEIYSRFIDDNREEIYTYLHTLIDKITIIHNGKMVFSKNKCTTLINGTEENAMRKNIEENTLENGIKENATMVSFFFRKLAECFIENKIIYYLINDFRHFLEIFETNPEDEYWVKVQNYIVNNITRGNVIYNVIGLLSKDYDKVVCDYLKLLLNEFHAEDPECIEIVIDITDDKISVKHYKKQISTKEECFDFTWVLTLEYDIRKNDITDYDILIEIIVF